MFSGIGSGINIANLNSLPTDLTFLFQTALKDHRSAQLVIFAHLVLCCFVDVDLWCSELSINQPSWVRPCLKLVRSSSVDASRAGLIQGWGGSPFPVLPGWGLARTLRQALGIKLTEQQLQKSLQRGRYPAIVP